MSAEWDDYLEAVQALASVPDRHDGRRKRIAAQEAAAVEAARAQLAEALQRSDGWEQLARRAVATAEAKLVTSQVLLPDPAAAQQATAAPGGQLADAVRTAESDLAADLASLDAARREAARQAAEDAVRAAAAAVRRRQLITYGGIAVILVALVLVIAFG
jgi:hypothetical protein